MKKNLFLKSDNPKHFSFIVFDFKFPSAPLGYYIFKNFLTPSFILNSPPPPPPPPRLLQLPFNLALKNNQTST